jgi:hypothetical protein
LSHSGRRLRNRFSGTAICRCEAEGVVLEPKSFRVRTMNFGQRWRTPEIVDVRYTIEVPLDYVCEFLATPLRDYREDAELHPDVDDDLECALRAGNWPSAEGALSQPTLFPLLLDFWAHDILLQWLGDPGPPTEPGFIVNTATTFDHVPHGIRIGGKCRRSGLPVLYQDD